METQKPHRRNIGVALLAGMMVAAPFFSLTAEAQALWGVDLQQMQQRQQQRQLEQQQAQQRRPNCRAGYTLRWSQRHGWE